jgi:hypothetical protein
MEATPEGKIIFRIAGPDVYYVHSDCETGAMKYVGVVRRIVTGYRSGRPVVGWERVGDKWTATVYKRRIDAARAMI